MGGSTQSTLFLRCHLDVTVERLISGEEYVHSFSEEEELRVTDGRTKENVYTEPVG